MDNFTKIRIALLLCLALGAGSISLRAIDTPAQAAARAALMQTLIQPDNPQTRSQPTTNTPAAVAVGQPAESAAAATALVSETAANPQISSRETTPASPTPVANAAIIFTDPSPLTVAAPAVHPAAKDSPSATPGISPVTLLLALIGLLLVALVVMVVLLLKLRSLKLMLLKNPTVMARTAEAARRRDAK
jgi:hypothetical protein